MIGTQFTGKVRSISLEGYGVVDHPEHFVFFVLGAFPDDEGTFEVLHLKKKYGFAKLISLENPSKDRQHTPCPHSGLGRGQCGGCPWMALPYPQQLQYKHHILEHALRRDRLVPEDFVLPPMAASPRIFGYRNRAQFKSDGQRIGYVSRFSRELAPINDCLTLNPRLRELLRECLKSLPNEKWNPGPNHPWSFLDMDDRTTLETLVANKRRPFRQANDEQNLFMKNWVRDKTKHWKGARVLELFCGSGNFTEVLAEQKPAHLMAVDIASEGVKNLKQNPLGDFCSVIEANLFKPSDWKILKNQEPQPDFLFLDPPRDGFSKLDMFVTQFSYPKEILYISCHLDSYVHDVGRLKKKGYQLTEVLGVDQFPHTSHLEILSLLRWSS